MNTAVLTSCVKRVLSVSKETYVCHYTSWEEKEEEDEEEVDTPEIRAIDFEFSRCATAVFMNRKKHTL